MYRAADDTLVLSPSDLSAFLACGHLTQLERRVADGRLTRPVRVDPELELLRRKGHEHERRELDRLEAEGRSVVRLDLPGKEPHELRVAEAATLAAMRAGVDVIYQASFFDGRWRGHADFLLRVEQPTNLGAWGYEVADTKLARRAKPEALLQLCAYAEHVWRLQGVWPNEVEVVTGGGERHRHRVADVVAYYRRAKSRLEAVLAGPTPDTYPVPVDHCSLCPWQSTCAARWQVDDHLSLVAGMRRDMVVKFARVGVRTVVDLAATSDGVEVPRMGLPTADRLRSQARLQLRQRSDHRIHVELLPPEDGDRGLAALPAPSPGDLFFDLEGDPWTAGGGLEYLWGVTSTDGTYSATWAHDPDAERAAFEGFVDRVIAALAVDPGMHVYHYAPYEVTALKRLMGRYASREAEVDRLLRGEVMVDLYRVVRQGVRASTSGYGLKRLEPLWLDPAERLGEIESGNASVIAYEEWLDSGDPHLLDALRTYNAVDCRSTGLLRDWLEERRADLALATGEPVRRPDPAAADPSEAQAEAEAAEDALAARLVDGVPADPDRRSPEQQGRWLLAALVGWHRREQKPEWWAWFDRLARSDSELAQDHECLGELTWEGELDGLPGVHRYRFDPQQEHKTGVGDEPVDPRTEKRAGVVVAIDTVAGTVDLRRPANPDVPHPRSLVPARPMSDTVLRRAVARVATRVADEGIDAAGPYRAVLDLLVRRRPRVRGDRAGAPLRRQHEHAADAAVRLAHDLDASSLVIQGPPGSGKTTTGARMVVDLVRAGRTVGLTAVSHKAITNLLDAVCVEAARQGVELRALQRASDDQACGRDCVECATNAQIETALAEGLADVVAGTPWLFARPGLAGAIDTLVVDEAGQLSLANVVAVAGAATDLVLLGDQQQLAQPSKGVHPPGAGVSALEHLLAGQATVPPERGLLLDLTWRLHPDICAFVSEHSYDGRLESDPSTVKQEVGAGPLLAGSGLRWLPVTHEGNRTRSVEEASVVARVMDALRNRPWIDAAGQQRWLTLEDILVIAPYNAQVYELVHALPPGARVGTVDRFQGQEAPVVVYSLAASAAEDVPRGIDFLFSPNRLNVAVSRARAMAVVVGSPELLSARCRTPEQLRAVNGLCRLVELAEEVDLSESLEVGRS